MKIYRKRYIPDEIVDISGDKIEYLSDDLMVTSWIPIKPREDFSYRRIIYFSKKRMENKQIL